MKKKIKPCKCGFCGQEPLVFCIKNDIKGAFVKCGSCKYIKVRTVVMDSEELAIEAWNDAWEQSRL